MSGKRWTLKEDSFLAFYGYCLGPKGGYAFVARHDLGRSENSGVRRIKWLRTHKPEFVARMEARADLDPSQNLTDECLTPN